MSNVILVSLVQFKDIMDNIYKNGYGECMGAGSCGGMSCNECRLATIWLQLNDKPYKTIEQRKAIVVKFRSKYDD